MSNETEKSPDPRLTDAQLAALWEGIIANGDAARAMAAHIVARQDAADVVSSASILFIESFQRAENPARLPGGEEEFRRRYLLVVRNHAIDCVRDSNTGERFVHSHWGADPEPLVGGRKTPDRPLDHVFARNDDHAYDAPAAAQAREQDNVDELEQIFRGPVAGLSRMQQIVIRETFFDGRKRAEVAARHRISVKTYDSHLQAAFEILRESLWYESYAVTDADRSSWYDRIDLLSDRYDDALGRRIAAQMIEVERLLSQIAASGREGDTQSRKDAA